MTKIVMFGFGPLPGEGLRVSGPGVRTWHFLNALRIAGHDICLIADRIHGAYPESLPDLVTQYHDGWCYHSLSDVRWHNPNTVRPLVKASLADCAIAVNTAACTVAAQVVGDLPLWGDLNGSIMAEAQMKALVYGDDSYLSHFWHQERRALERVDIFSTVSDRQKWSLIGELGLWGRLNHWTCGYEFAVSIPNAVEAAPFPAAPRRVIRGIYADDEAFVILYSGGYNTWTDVDTMFYALEAAMRQRADLVFVSTGGKIDGHDDLTYTRFQSLIAASVFSHRFHLCGWVPAEDLAAYYLESNIGLSTDRLSYEAMLGSRNRILDWMRAKLPSISSSLTELTEQVVAAGAGLSYMPGSVDDLTACLLRCAADRPGTAIMGQKAFQLLADRFTFEATTRPLLAWAANPSHAPDFGRDSPKLVSPGQGVAAGMVQAFGQRSLGLALALQLWPAIARITDVLHLGWLQKYLVKIGMSALRLNRPPYRVRYDHYKLPRQMAPGEVYTATVRVYNIGINSWPCAKNNKNGVNLAYHWRTREGVMLVRDGTRSSLPNDLPAGKDIRLPLSLIAPIEPGIYQLELDMVWEGITWFSEVGSSGPKFTIMIRPEQVEVRRDE